MCTGSNSELINGLWIGNLNKIIKKRLTLNLTCPGSKEKSGFLCYDKCESGYVGIGSKCLCNQQ